VARPAPLALAERSLTLRGTRKFWLIKQEFPVLQQGIGRTLLGTECIDRAVKRIAR
jgi:hypothetical protein